MYIHVYIHMHICIYMSLCRDMPQSCVWHDALVCEVAPLPPRMCSNRFMRGICVSFHTRANNTCNTHTNIGTLFCSCTCSLPLFLVPMSLSLSLSCSHFIDLALSLALSLFHLHPHSYPYSRSLFNTHANKFTASMASRCIRALCLIGGDMPPVSRPRRGFRTAVLLSCSQVSQPVAFGVSFLQSQISIDGLVLYCHVPLKRDL